jgi:hypothetical protein
MHMERHELAFYTEGVGQPTRQTPSAGAPAAQATSVSWPRQASYSSTGAEENALPGGDSGSVTSQFPDLMRAANLYCPVCGAHEMLPLAQAIARAGLTAAALKNGLETGRYHLHCSLDGEWLVCSQSMESAESL